MRKQDTLKIIYWMFLLMVSFLLNSCSIINREPDYLLIKLSDLPDGWTTSWQGCDDEQDNTTCTIHHLGPFDINKHADNNSLMFVKQHAYIYQSENQAQENYHVLEKDFFYSDYWIHPENTTFSPRSSKDLYRLACKNFMQRDTPESDPIPVTNCRYMHQHKNILVFVYVTFDGEDLTFTEFERLLDRTDKRLRAY